MSMGICAPLPSPEGNVINLRAFRRADAHIGPYQVVTSKTICTSEEKQKSCHPEQAQRVEGSTHLVAIFSPFGAKILRLAVACSG